MAVVVDGVAVGELELLFGWVLGLWDRDWKGVDVEGVVRSTKRGEDYAGRPTWSITVRRCRG